MNAIAYPTEPQNRSFKCINNFLNGSNKKGYTIKVPVLSDNGVMEGYCIQKFDKWNHLIEETFFNIDGRYLLKIMITNDLSGFPLRKDIFDEHGQRICDDSYIESFART